MADNSALPLTSTETYASDDIGGIKFQRIKLVIGGDGTNLGDLQYTLPLPVQLHNDTNTATALMPPAAALADTTSNPTTTKIATFAHLFDGTNWHRTRGDTTNGIDVDVTRVSGTITTTRSSATTGGANPAKLISAATTNATLVKNAAGTLYSVTVGNTNAAARYLKWYNKATAPTIGTDTPVQVYTVQGNSTLSVHLPSPGLEFTLGIGFGLTTGAADSDTGAVAASELVLSYSTE